MAVMRWQPIVELGTLQRQLDQVFDELAPGNSRPSPVLRTHTRTTWVPPVELKESSESLTLRALLPGIHQDDLDIQVTRESVLLAGEHRPDPTTPNAKLHDRSEFNYGKFRRVIALPIAIDNTNVTAKLEHGVLTLTLPKAPEVLNRIVKVSLNHSDSSNVPHQEE